MATTTPHAKLKSDANSKAPAGVGKEAARVGRFGLVGVVNTLIDFAILNIVSRVFGLSDLAANIPATTVAMVFSFFANRTFVFRANSSKADKAYTYRQALRFFAFTAFGLYGIQSGIIFLFEHVWTTPVGVGVYVAQSLGLLQLVDQKFIVTNGVKLVATAASLIWNYVMYKRFVFRDKD